MNTAISSTTNINWQNYADESTVSYLSQMLALAFHQFLSAATGVALAMALIRGLARRSAQTIGHFYVDITPSDAVSATAALGDVHPHSRLPGRDPELSRYTSGHGLSGLTQVIAQSPVASMEAIKDLGSNGGGSSTPTALIPSRTPMRSPTPSLSS